MTRAEIITIGDELLIGQVINTNQAHIAQRLNAVGVAVDKMTTVGDTMEAVLSAFDEAWKTRDVVVVTGGLGPTHDDITKKAVCLFFKTDLVVSESVREHIRMLRDRRGLPWNASAEEQALLPRSAVILPNPVGTAAGMLFEQPGKSFFVLPGVPYEMKEIVEGSILPYLREHVRGSVIRHRTLRTAGIAESVLAEKIGDVESFLDGATLAFLPSASGVRLRISVNAATEEEADRKVEAVESRIRAKIEKHVFGTDTVELEESVGTLLLKHGLTIAIAESCTGGLIADRITNVSGSSAYFDRGVVTYSNASKSALLGVPEELIAKHGAVSREVAEAMAEGVRRTAGTSIGLSTTGVAGPTGGSNDKPVGLVWIGYADGRETLALRFMFGEDRLRVKERAGHAALELLRRKILKIE